MGKFRKVFQVVGFGISAFGAVRALQNARREGTKLDLADALFSLALVGTGIAIAVRDMRAVKDEYELEV